MTVDVTTEVSEVWIDYFPEYVDKSEDHDAYLRGVKGAIPLILDALRFIKDKPLEHIMRIKLTGLEEPPIHVELNWASGVECTVYLHDKNYGLDPIESCVGLVQIGGLYTKTVKRWLKEIARMKEATLDIMGGSGDPYL